MPICMAVLGLATALLAGPVASAEPTPVSPTEPPPLSAAQPPPVSSAQPLHASAGHGKTKSRKDTVPEEVVVIPLPDGTDASPAAMPMKMPNFGYQNFQVVSSRPHQGRRHHAHHGRRGHQRHHRHHGRWNPGRWHSS